MTIARLPHIREAATDIAAGRLRSLSPDVTEKRFQLAVRRYAESQGWMVFCTTDSRRSPAGEPDLRLVRGSTQEMIWAENKSRTGRLSLKQQQAIAELKRAGQRVEVWRPFPEQIERIISMLRR